MNLITAFAARARRSHLLANSYRGTRTVAPILTLKHERARVLIPGSRPHAMLLVGTGILSVNSFSNPSGDVLENAVSMLMLVARTKYFAIVMHVDSLFLVIFINYYITTQK